jgi:hypothetical protein
VLAFQNWLYNQNFFEIPLSSKKTRRNDKSSNSIANWVKIFVVKKQCTILQPTFIPKNNEIPLSSKKTKRNDKRNNPIANWGEKISSNGQ